MFSRHVVEKCIEKCIVECTAEWAIFEIIIVFMIMIAMRSYAMLDGLMCMQIQKYAIFKINVFFMMLIVMLAECTHLISLLIFFLSHVCAECIEFPRGDLEKVDLVLLIFHLDFFESYLCGMN